MDTITALATPPGRGAIAIVRLSGPAAISIANTLCTAEIGKYPSHSAQLTNISIRKKFLDQVICLVMHSPRSYTGEEMVELHTHGSSLIANALLNALIEAGARPAHPGEFTMRAFLNKKLDLTQAEGIQTLINARSERALHTAQKQLSGAFSSHLQKVYQRLTTLIASLESAIDYPDDIPLPETLTEEIDSISTLLNTLADTFRHGDLLQRGARIVLVGVPNVGKSSLLNVLLEEEKAIVTSTPGTTRDPIDGQIVIGGIPATLTDTAGLREDSDDPIEREGINRAERIAEQADLRLLLLDATNPKPLPVKSPYITLWHKADLGTVPCPVNCIPTSAVDKRGLKALRERIATHLNSENDDEGFILTNARHYTAVKNALQALAHMQENIESPIDLLALDARTALKEIGLILGLDTSEEVLNAIFSNFCVGK